MTELYRCPNCSRMYRADKLAECPGCFQDSPWIEDDSSVSGKTWGKSTDSRPNDFLSTTTLVAAQDKTTHAIRSLSVFVLVSISTSLIGYLIIAASAGSVFGCSAGDSDCYSRSGFAIFFGVSVIALGFLTALVLGIRELILSKP